MPMFGGNSERNRGAVDKSSVREPDRGCDRMRKGIPPKR